MIYLHEDNKVLTCLVFCSTVVYKVSYAVHLDGRVVHPVSVRPILGEVLLTQLKVCFGLILRN